MSNTTIVFDILRNTKTDSEFTEEAVIYDLWPDDGARELSVPWTGTTSLEILRPKPKKITHGWMDVKRKSSKQRALQMFKQSY